ncbi:MAG: DUF1638 domain-containing protein [Pelagimonas sp.]
MSPSMTNTADDDTLTTAGLAASGNGQILLLACGALAREILDLKQRNGWDHMDLTCLPAILHVHPERITDAVRNAVAKHRDTYAKIYVVYADCGTGGLLQAACQELGVEMVQGPHCYAFFDGLKAFEDRGEVTSFFLTDFLVRQFDSFVWKPLGLDRHPELLPMYFGNYEKLVYLAQTDDPDLVVLAKQQAARMGLLFEHRQTGYGDLETTLESWAAR